MECFRFSVFQFFFNNFRTDTHVEPLVVTRNRVHIVILFDSLSFHVYYLFKTCLCFDLIPPLQKSKTGKDQKYISFKNTNLLLLHMCVAKTFDSKKYKNKIQIVF